MKRLLRIILIVSTGLAAMSEPARAEAPRRIVSFNLCADQLVTTLADPQQIVALSPYATDASVSVVAAQAKQFPQLDWRAEGTLTLKPDLVLVGTDDRSTTRRMLQRFGVRVVELDLVSNLDEGRRQITEVAALLGHPERGKAMIAALDAAERKLAALPRPVSRTALVLDREGYTQGTESLVSALIGKAGLTPPAGAPQGYGGFVALETILTLKPDVIVLRDPPATPSDQGSLALLHPALLALYPPAKRIALPTRYTFCGGPALVAALDYLAQEMTRLAPQAGGGAR